MYKALELVFRPSSTMQNTALKIIYEGIRIAGESITCKKLYQSIAEESPMKASVRHLTLLVQCTPNKLDAFYGDFSALKCIEDFTRDVHDVLVALIVLECYHRYLKARDEGEELATALSELLSEVHEVHSHASFSWMPLCAYLTCGVRGLLVAQRGKNAYSIGNAFAIVHIAAWIQTLEETPPPTEPIWKRTNNYILELIGQATGYWNDSGFKTVQPCKIRLSKCLASDYGNYWYERFPDIPNPLIPKAHKSEAKVQNCIVTTDVTE